MHAVAPRTVALTIPPGLLFIFGGVLWYWFEVDKQSLKEVLTTFRGFTIAMLVISIWFCDIMRPLLSGHQTNPWIILLYDLCTWTTALAILLSIDCVHNVSNWMRFISPSTAVLNAFHNIFEILNDDKPVLFRIDNGAISIDQIEISATIELILFMFTLMFAVPLDYHHHFYSIITEKVQRKRLLPHKDYGRVITEIDCFCGLIDCSGSKIQFRTIWFYRLIAIFGIIGGILYIITTWTNIQFEIGTLIFTIFFSIIVVIMLWKHFEWKICRRLLSSFRPCMLVISLLIRLYCPLQATIWKLSEYSDINVLCYTVSYDLGMLLLLTRDGMLVTYPARFTVILSVVMFLFSLFNIMRLQFYGQNGWPSWFVYLDKVAYIQVMMLSALTLKCTVFDWDFKYFVLIRNSKSREMKEIQQGVYDVLEHGDDADDSVSSIAGQGQGDIQVSDLGVSDVTQLQITAMETLTDCNQPPPEREGAVTFV